MMHMEESSNCFEDSLSTILKDLQHELLNLHWRVVESASKNRKYSASSHEDTDTTEPPNSITNLESNDDIFAIASDCHCSGTELKATRPMHTSNGSTSGADSFVGVLAQSNSLAVEDFNSMESQMTPVIPGKSEQKRKLHAVSFENVTALELNTPSAFDVTHVIEISAESDTCSTKCASQDSTVFPKSPTAPPFTHPLKRQNTGASSQQSHDRSSLTMELLPVWLDTHNHSEHHRPSEFSLQSALQSRTMELEFEHGESQDEGSQCRNLLSFMIHPLSTKRICWDLLSLLCIMWDLFTIPLQVFDPPSSKETRSVQLMTIIFWTLDLPLSFITGTLMQDGDIQIDPARIARQYLKGWFFLDLIIVSFDWITVILDDVDGLVGVPRALRCFRLVRLFRIGRIVKLPETIALVGERIWSEHILIVAGVTKIISLILSVAHVLACLWYGVSRLNSSGSNWVAQGGYDSEDWYDLYIRCFHWSMAQFVGELLIAPVNAAERTFAIAVVLLTFIVAAGVVSSITSSMTRITFLAGKRGTQLATLRKYLLTNGVSQKLMMRIQRNAQHALLQKQQKMTEAQVELISIISEPLRVELHFEEHGTKLCHHPFLQFYMDICPAAMRQLCHSAVSEKIFYHGDVIFSVGELPSSPHMYFISSGSLIYQQTRSTDNVSPGMWLSEACLWVRWVHRGILRAKNESQVLELSASSFQDITSSFESGVFHPIQYAIEYVEHIKSLASEGTLSDLGNTLESHEMLEAVFRTHEAAQNTAFNAKLVKGQSIRNSSVKVRFSTPFGSTGSPGGGRTRSRSFKRQMTPRSNEEEPAAPGSSWLAGGANFLSRFTGRRQDAVHTSRTSVSPLDAGRHNLPVLEESLHDSQINDSHEIE